MRRIRRTRPGTNRNAVINVLKAKLSSDPQYDLYMKTGQRKRAFGRLLNSWLDSETRESVIDRYVDEEAFSMTWAAINTVYR